MHKTLIVAIVALFAAFAGCKSGDGVSSYYKARITAFFLDRGGNVGRSYIYTDRDGILTMTDGIVTVECYPDGDCRECGDK